METITSFKSNDCAASFRLIYALETSSGASLTCLEIHSSNVHFRLEMFIFAGSGFSDVSARSTPSNLRGGGGVRGVGGRMGLLAAAVTSSSSSRSSRVESWTEVEPSTRLQNHKAQ